MASIQSYDEESWDLCSSGGVESVNSGIESSVLSSSPTPSETVQSQEFIDVAEDMTIPTERERFSSPRAFLSHPIDVTEWVQCQSIASQQSAEMEANRNELPKTTISSDLDAKSPIALSAGLGQTSKVPSNPPSTYDIPTLIAIGTKACSDQMELRIRPGALSENVFKYKSRNGNSKSCEKLRHRGVSEDSDLTHRSIKSDEEVLFSQSSWDYARPPFRQPISPPEKTSVQQHEGFRRFLKQVASPPHQRVTAGGRIVPVNPQSPPPVMNFGSIDATLKKPSAPKQSTRLAYKDSEQVNNPEISTSGSKSFAPLGDDSHGRSHIPKPFGQSAAAAWNPHAQDVGCGPWNYQVSAILPAPAGMVPVLFLPAGDAVVWWNGVYSRIYFNGHTLFPEPLPIDSSFITSPEQLIAACYETPYNLQAAPAFVSSDPRTHNPDASNPQGNSQMRIDALNKTLEKLRSELSGVDRRMAANFNKLTPPEIQTLAAQREWLVKQIDVLRVEKDRVPEQLPHQDSKSYMHHEVAQNDPFASVPPASVISYSSVQKTPQYAKSHAHMGAPSASNSTMNRQPSRLSPDAAPFIPSSATIVAGHADCHDNQGYSRKPEITSANTFSNRQNTASSHVTAQGKSFETMSFSKIDGQISELPKDAIDDSVTATNYSSNLIYEDVEYVDRLGLNRSDGKKIYCSTVEEFQEVIRQVREQAKIYGCEGGQSKDPSYDAEEDIRWAMKDNIPIPLPPVVPDHILRPRPWNWADSIFNHRSHEENAVPFTSISEPNSVSQQHIRRNSHNRVHRFESIPQEPVPQIEQDLLEHLPGKKLNGSSQPINYIPRYLTDSRPLAWALEAFGYEAALAAFRTSPEYSTDDANDANQNEEEFKFYLNDGFDPRFSDGGRYTVKYEEILLPVQYKDPHSIRKLELLNPIFDHSTRELVYADGGPPGYEQDMARYAEKYGHDNAKSRSDGMNPCERVQEFTSHSAPIFDIPTLKDQPAMKMSGMNRTPLSINAPISPSTLELAHQTAYAKKNGTLRSKHRKPTQTSEVRQAYQPPNKTAYQEEPISQVSSIKPERGGSFLQGMLKSPRFSMQTKKSIHWAPEEAGNHQTQTTGSVEDYPEDPNVKKENADPHIQSNRRAIRIATSQNIPTPVPLIAGQDVHIQKAQSSLASSDYNACGYLPQYNHHADAYLGSSNHQFIRHTFQHGPSGPSPNRTRRPRHVATRDNLADYPHKYRSMGAYDGACDPDLDSAASQSDKEGTSSSSPKNSEQSATKSKYSDTIAARQSFDLRGLTVDEFSTTRRVFAPGYEKAIRRFFKKLREQDYKSRGNNSGRKAEAKGISALRS